MARFCTIEGVDGSGKSHLAARLQRHVASSGIGERVVVLRKDDHGHSLSPWVQRRLKRMHELTWSYNPDEPVWHYSRQYWLHALASWYALFHDQVVAPQLERNAVVVVDGWYFKHQARFHLSGIPALIQMADLVFGSLPQPDAVLLLDTPIEHAAQRKAADSKPSEHGAFDGGHSRDAASFVAYQGRSNDQLYSLVDTHDAHVHSVASNAEPVALLDLLLLGKGAS